MLPIKVRSIYSFCKSVLKVEDIVSKFKEEGFNYAVLCDINSLSGSYAFYKACKKEDLIPVIGLELYYEEKPVLLFAKNKEGWFELCQLLSKSQSEKTLKLEWVNSKSNILCVLENDIDNITIEKHITDPLEDIRYFNEDQFEDLQVALCSNMGTTLPKIKNLISKNEVFENQEFFLQYKDFSFSKTDIFSSVEKFDLEQPPELPKCYDGDEVEIIRQMCRKGWSEKKSNLWDKDVYANRVKEELEILKKFKLAGYFLIIKDIIDYARKNEWLCMARGSVGGSLIAYLLGISIADPIKHKLLLSRFINKARLGEKTMSFDEFPIKDFKDTV